MSTMVNHWHDDRCAKAFWSQGDMPAYERLLSDTIELCAPQPGQHWLDLGCGGGRLSRSLWKASRGALGSVVGVDCAEANEKLIAALANDLGTDRITFRQGDLSQGLPSFADGTLDGVMSGLAIQYAEHYCPQRQCWTRDAYEGLLADVHRVLNPGGVFVFSVNVPRPAWLRLTLSSALGFFRSGRPVKYLKNNFRMIRYGSWLKKQARIGRFHYLPEETVRECLTRAGFTNISVRRSYAGLAYVFRACRG